MNEKIIFYDGDCGLCQRSIYFISYWDRNHVLLFAPLNGVTYKRLIKEPSNMTTVVFFMEDKLYTKSEAIIKIGWILSGWSRLLILLKIIPRFIRDAIYNIVANNRKKVSCIILTKDERFLN